MIYMDAYMGATGVGKWGS